MRNLILMASMMACVQAQWLHYPDARTSRTKDGKPNLSAPAPRMNGKPDLTGVWEIDQTPLSELKGALPPDFFELQIDVPGLSKYALNLLWDFKPADNPSRPETAALVEQRSKNSLRDLPPAKCLPGSVPYSLLI